MRPAKLLLPLGTALAGLVLLASVRHVLLPFVLAALAAYLANPLFDALEVRGFRRERMVALFYAVFFVAVVLGGTWAVNRVLLGVEKLRTNYPVYLMELDKALTSVEASLFEIPYAEALLKDLLANWQEGAARLVKHLPSVAAGLLPLLTLAFLVPFIAFFLMAGGPGMLNAALDFVPSRYVEMALHIVSEIDGSLGAYFRGLLLEALAVGGVCLVGLWAVGLHSWLEVSVLTAVANLVPYVGPVVGGIVGGILALLQFKSLGGVLAVLAVFAVVQFLDGWVIQPIIFRSAVEIHPVTLLFALMAGAELGGAVGAVFAVPAACMALVCLEVGWDWYRTEFSIRPDAAPAAADRIPLV